MSQPSAALHAPESSALQAESQRSLLRMSAGGEVLAVPIEAVREILELGRMTALPRTPEFVRGVMNLRGAVVPVVDLATRLGQGPSPIGRRSCIVVVSTDADLDQGLEAMVIGLLVDAVYEVFDTDIAQVEPVPSLGTRTPAHFLAGMTRARGEVVPLLALDRVLAAHELSEAIGAHQPH